MMKLYLCVAPLALFLEYASAYVTLSTQTRSLWLKQQYMIEHRSSVEPNNGSVRTLEMKARKLPRKSTQKTSNSSNSLGANTKWLQVIEIVGFCVRVRT